MQPSHGFTPQPEVNSLVLPIDLTDNASDATDNDSTTRKNGSDYHIQTRSQVNRNGSPMSPVRNRRRNLPPSSGSTRQVELYSFSDIDYNAIDS